MGGPGPAGGNSNRDRGAPWPINRASTAVRAGCGVLAARMRRWVPIKAPPPPGGRLGRLLRRVLEGYRPQNGGTPAGPTNVTSTPYPDTHPSLPVQPNSLPVNFGIRLKPLVLWDRSTPQCTSKVWFVNPAGI